VGSKRTVILIAALLIGAVAAFSLYSYVNGIEDRAYNHADRVPVYVVAQRIPANTSGKAVLGNKLILTKQVPKEFMPPSALLDPSTIADKFAKTDLAQGQIVVSDMFVDKQAATSTWRDQLPSDQVAIRVQMDQVKGLGGIIQPGDKVTMLVELDGTEGPAADGGGASAAAAAAGATAAGKSIRFLYSNVEVMAIDNAGVSVSGTAAAPAGGPIMFKVPLAAAEKIALAGSKLYLALEPEGFVPADTDLAPMDWNGVFQGEKSPYKNKKATSTTTATGSGTTTGASTSTGTSTTTTSKP
jgi:Flp pilus assembly protein CpaB